MLQKVATTGVDLDNVYDETLRRIKEQNGGRSRLGMEVLMWVSHAGRPLRIDEICHALAVEIGATDLDLENVRPQSTVLGSCLGLVIIDEKTSAVRLIHYTLQEYLSRPGILPDAHRTLGQTCLIYLNYDQVKALPADNTLNLANMPFLEYSSLYWGVHAKIELSDHAKSLALQLLNRYDSHICSLLLFERTRTPWLQPASHRPFPSLHCASYFGINEVVDTLLEREGCDINQGDCMGLTPLIWASRQGNQETVMLLLTRDDINPRRRDDCGGTPLWWAAYNGHEGVVRLLLARSDVDPDKPDNDGETPLWRASLGGHEGVVRLLLARDDVNPDKPHNNNGTTPLWCASRNGHQGVLRLLIARDDVNPDKPDNDGVTPLWCASRNGHEGVVRLLLARDDVNPDKPDNDGETPLWCASRNGHVEVARLLLARGDVNPDKPDNYGETPFHIASRRGNEGVVRQLLFRGAINPDLPRPDSLNSHSSAFSSDEEVAISVADDVDSDEPDNDNQTLFRRAPSNGHQEVATSTVAQDDVNPDETDNSGQAPPRISSMCRYRRIIAKHILRCWGKKRKWGGERV